MTTTRIGDDLAAIAAKLRRCTVAVHDAGGGGGGSGLVWRADGVVVTNAHVVRGRRSEVIDSAGNRAHAAVVRIDAGRDLAALQIDERAVGRLEVAVATARDSRTVRSGELAVAVGNPLGLAGAVTAGLVHSCNSRWVIADVTLEPGNSGGPLADASGHVLGINSMIAGGLALAVPANAVTAFFNGDRRKPQLGVRLAAVEVGRNGKKAAAFLITDVLAESRAERAGLILGDTIVAADEASVSARTTALQLAHASKLEILRAGRLRVATIEPDGRGSGANTA